MQKSLFYCLLIVLGYFIWQYKYGKGNYIEDRKIKTQITNLESLNSNLKARNQDLIIKIRSLKGSNDALEAHARNVLNLVKPNETLILLPGNHKIDQN